MLSPSQTRKLIAAATQVAGAFEKIAKGIETTAASLHEIAEAIKERP